LFCVIKERDQETPERGLWERMQGAVKLRAGAERRHEEIGNPKNCQATGRDLKGNAGFFKLSPCLHLSTVKKVYTLQ